MKVLFIGSVVGKNRQDDVIKNSKTTFEFSANVVQEKLLCAFRNLCNDFQVVSAAGIGSFPNAYKKAYFKGFKGKDEKISYVKFNNVWGIRNISRANAIKREIKRFVNDKSQDKIIVIYSVHTPFLSALEYAKKKDSTIKTLMIVPDLPQYMNLSKKKSLLYRIGKKYDIKKFNSLNKYVDSYMLLTESMKELLPMQGKPYFVCEGIVEDKEFGSLQKNKAHEKCVVYTGKMSSVFGVVNLVKAFKLIEDKEYRLNLIGAGEDYEEIKKLSADDDRITVFGQVPASTAKEWINKAGVLVNPRLNDEEYTKYSFPSKTIEYLMSGNKVVAYKLDGMKEDYIKFLTVPLSDSIEDLKSAIVSGKKGESFISYAKENLKATSVCEKIIALALGK